MSTLRVGIVGYGTIGKRVASAVQAQPDMRLTGVVIRQPGVTALGATIQGIRLFAFESDGASFPVREAIPTIGTLDDLLHEIDVVIDCTPARTASAHLLRYKQACVPAIFQGGEQHDRIGFTFCPYVNFAEAAGQRAIRILSCNTTGLARLTSTMHSRWGIRQIYGSLVSCATDPDKAHKGNPTAATPTLGISHHAHDINRLWPQIAIYTQTVSVPMIRGHIGMLTFLLDSPTTFDAVAEVLRKAPRVLLGTATMGKTTAELGAYFSDKGRQRGDWPEVFIWEESLQVRERVVHLIMAVHMESIVIPDTIDCLRAVSGGDPSVQNCMWQTDAALRIAKTHECYEELSL